MDILSIKAFYVYITILTARLDNLPKFMIVLFESSALPYILQARNDDPYI